MSKRAWIVLLAGLNAVLLFALIGSVAALPNAMAQGIPGASGGDFLMLTSQADSDLDGLFLVDVTQQRLHALVPIRGSEGRLTYLAHRSLEADFAEERDARGKR